MIKDHLAGGASRLAALLLPQILPVFSVVAPGQPGAALRDLVLVQPGHATSWIRHQASRSIILAAAAMLIASAANARPAAPQRGGGPPAPAATPQNLQVLPKDMPLAQVQQTMQNIAAGLGVQCTHCHAPAAAAAPEGRGGGRGRGGAAAPPLNYASDEKPAKKVARDMMLMVRDINPKIGAAIGKPAETAARVGCVTCHRGVAIPRQLAEILDQTTMQSGTPAAVTQYKELRKQYFGAQAYDFSEGSLVTYAQRATQANKPDDAIAWLQLNLEHFPLSSRTYAGLSQAQQRKNDKEAAIKSLEKAVELDPANAAETAVGSAQGSGTEVALV